jgi:phosphate starvation-inducible protein PhoH and related proteins
MKKSAINRRKRKEASRKILPLSAKTENQKDYIRNIADNEIVFCTGPSGSGKSYIAAGIAANLIFTKQVDQIIVTRPLVCAGKDIGSLPGELDEKIKPYLMPMEENLRHFLGRDFYAQLFNGRKIRYEPLEVMRGATFHEAYMILDEAQNCTIEQIKMFVTRMGEGSKVLVNGDTRQTDINRFSGLMECIDRLDGVKGVGISQLYYEDIQRNGIIGRVLEALEEEYYD